MKAKPTPGAWRQVVTSVYAGNLLLAVTPTRSASYPEAAQYDVDVANARLMAASPALLDALREAIGCIEILADACGDRVREVDVAKFYAVINKATGA